MKTTQFTQNVEFNALPEKVYDLLMDEKKHSAFTGAEAKITNSAGGSFSAWDMYITGKNITLIKGKKIVQEWHAADMPGGHVSIITFIFRPIENERTALIFTHENVPADLAASYAQGWIDHYWEPMKAFLAAY